MNEIDGFSGDQFDDTAVRHGIKDKDRRRIFSHGLGKTGGVIRSADALREGDDDVFVSSLHAVKEGMRARAGSGRFKFLVL